MNFKCSGRHQLMLPWLHFDVKKIEVNMNLAIPNEKLKWILHYWCFPQDWINRFILHSTIIILPVKHYSKFQTYFLCTDQSLSECCMSLDTPTATWTIQSPCISYSWRLILFLQTILWSNKFVLHSWIFVWHDYSTYPTKIKHQEICSRFGEGDVNFSFF